MDHTISSLLPQDFDPRSRVWIYQANRSFSDREEQEINEQLYQFTEQWAAHGAGVKGWGKLLFNRFIVLMADERETAVSGCSTDSSVRIIKSLERQYNVQLFDRLLIAFLINDKVEALPLGQLPYAFEKGFIGGDTLFFNNTVLNKAELERNWLIPVKGSWLEQKIRPAVMRP